jgi:peroxiredoxin
MSIRSILVGRQLPNVKLGVARGQEVQAVDAFHVFGVGRSIILGVPGAFTPVCTGHHVPDFVQNADKLHASGFSQVACIAPNDPFVLAEWAARLDPAGRILFLSDGNLDFTNALGLQMSDRDLFLSGRSERYLLTIERNMILSVRVEPNIMAYTCTRAADAFEAVTA